MCSVSTTAASDSKGFERVISRAAVTSLQFLKALSRADRRAVRTSAPVYSRQYNLGGAGWVVLALGHLIAAVSLATTTIGLPFA